MKKLLYIICSICTFFGCRAEAETSLQTIELYFVSNPTEAGSLSDKFEVFPAVTDEQWARGLMYKKDADLAEHQGMLFIFPEEAPRSFWMHNTYISLDIIFIDADKNVVSLIEKAKPLSDTPLPSIFPARYVVEIRGGLAKKLGITRGSKVVFDAP